MKPVKKEDMKMRMMRTFLWPIGANQSSSDEAIETKRPTMIATNKKNNEERSRTLK